MLQWGHDEGVVEGFRHAARLPLEHFCFNGATTKVSWKASAEASIAARCRGSFNGATTKVSWKADPQRSTFAELQLGFNGATTMVSWKAQYDAGYVDGIRVASMGPRRRCRGRRLVLRPNFAVGDPRFNGATTMVSWKAHAEPTRPTWLAVWLQWGHDEGVVEGDRPYSGSDRRRQQLQWGHDEGVVEGSTRAASTSARRVVASMGPRRRCRGRRCTCRASLFDTGNPLQWGHDEGVVEGVTPILEPERLLARFNGATTMVSWKAPITVPVEREQTDTLQWGHDEGVVEGHVGTSDHFTDMAVASMGPRRWCRGRRASRTRMPIVDASPASMGPRRWCRGRRLVSRSWQPSGVASMGPRRRCRGRRRRPAGPVSG